MRWLALLVGLLAAPAMAQQNVLLFQPPLSPILHLNFTNMGTLDPRVHFEATGTENDWTCAATPVMQTFGSNQPALGVCDPTTGNSLGLGVWGNGNLVANSWARDLTQADWVKTGVTATKDQIGLLGDANGATRLTATAPNATICQSVGTTAFQRIFSGYVKRSLGSGEIDMSLDGVNWSPITSSLKTGAWTRLPLPPRGLYAITNGGNACFRIVTSGDQIIVDGANVSSDANHLNIDTTPPVFTTASKNVSRRSDNVYLDLAKIPGWTSDSWTAVVKYLLPVWRIDGDNTNFTTLRRTAVQVDNGAGWNSLDVNNQSDTIGLGTACNLPGVVITCPDSNMAAFINNVAATVGKIHTAMIPGAGELKSVAPPQQQRYGAVAMSYDGAGDFTAYNSGAPSQTLNNAYLFQGASTPENRRDAISPAFPAGAFNRLVFGAAPTETYTFGGTPTAGDIVTATLTAPTVNGGVGVPVIYTVQGGDNLASVEAGLAAAITANGTLAAAGVSASVSSTNVFISHSGSIWETLTGSTTSATMTFAPGVAANIGQLNGYIQEVWVYRGAYKGRALVSLLPPLGSPTVSRLKLLSGGFLLLETGETLVCNNC